MERSFTCKECGTDNKVMIELSEEEKKKIVEDWKKYGGYPWQDNPEGNDYSNDG